MSINELYDEIDKLNQQIEDEKKNSLKRKLKIDFEIEELENEKKRAGLRSEFLSVQKYNSKIKRLKEDKSTDYTLKFKSEIENCKRKISNIIFNYYENGNTIDDIIKIENISPDIYENWFNLSNFGKNSGYLFVDCINNSKEKWHYLNPINNVEFYSKSLDNLKYQIDKSDEVLIIFNNDLANNSKKRDLKIHQGVIDEKLLELEEDNCYAESIFNYLKNYSDKFSEVQLNKLCRLMIDNCQINFYANDFIYIINVNKDKFDNIDYDDIYSQIINAGLNYLAVSDFIYSINPIRYLIYYSDNFSKKQLNALYNLVIVNDKLFGFSEYFKYIFDINKDKFDMDYRKICKSIIDIRIKYLKDEELSIDLSEDIINDLKDFAYYFNKDQLCELCDIIINNPDICYFAEDLNYIINVNEHKFNEIDYDKIYRDIIRSRIKKLNNLTKNSRVKGILSDLIEYFHLFTENQLLSFCKVVKNENLISYFDDDILNSFIQDMPKYENSNRVFYEIIIDVKLDELENLTFGYTTARDILIFLGRYANKFSLDQLSRLRNISTSNSQISKCFICTEHLDYIFNENEWG